MYENLFQCPFYYESCLLSGTGTKTETYEMNKYTKNEMAFFHGIENIIFCRMVEIITEKIKFL